MRKHAYWWDLEPHNNTYYDFVPNEAEIVVIGAGIAGISAAYWLAAHKQKSILLIDSAPWPGHRGAGRELGMMLACGGKDLAGLTARVGAEKARIYLQATRGNNKMLAKFVAKNRVPCNLSTNGGLRLAGCLNEAKDLTKIGERMKEHGINVVKMSESQIESIVPSNKLHGGLFVPGEGSLDPFAFVSFVSRILHESAGVRFCHSVGNVAQVTKSARGAYRHVLLENGHEIKCRIVIHANSITPPLENAFIPFREHAIANEELPDNIFQLFPQMPMLINGSEDYFRLDDHNLLSSGGRFAAEKGEIFVRDDVGYNPDVYNTLSSNLARLFPMTTIVGHTHAWSFVSIDTPDGLPIIGPLADDPRQFVISGLGSHRYSVAFMAGRIVSEQIRGKKIGPSEAAFSPSRFTSK